MTCIGDLKPWHSPVGTTTPALLPWCCYPNTTTLVLLPQASLGMLVDKTGRGTAGNLATMLGGPLSANPDNRDLWVEVRSTTP